MEYYSKQRSQDGFSLVPVLVISLIVGLLMTALFGAVLPSFNTVQRTKTITALRCAAESGLDYAVNRLANNDTTFVPQSGATLTPTIPSSAISTYGGMPMTVSCEVKNIACPSSSYLYNELLDNTKSSSAIASNGWNVVTATATNGVNTHRLRAVMKPVYTTTNGQGDPFFAKYGLTGRDDVTGQGNPTYDSINSANGKTKTGNGDLAANDQISMGGSPTVNGDVFVTDTSKAVGSYSTGQVKTISTMVFPDVPDVPSTAKSWPVIDTKSKTVTVIPPGDYYITANSSYAIRLGGQSSISISGPTRIWIKGTSPQVDLTGGGLANSGVAANFQLFYKPNNPSVTEAEGTTNIVMGGNSALNAVIYAPNANVQVKGTGDFIGAIVARDIAYNGTGTFYYDEALGQTPLFFQPPSNVNTFQRAQCVSWQELQQ